jgi:hypothetical protein
MKIHQQSPRTDHLSASQRIDTKTASASQKPQTLLSKTRRTDLLSSYKPSEKSIHQLKLQNV